MIRINSLKFDCAMSFVEHCNGLRKVNKDNWVVVQAMVNDKEIGVKFFNTWSQIISNNALRESGLMGLNVTKWKKEILEAVQR